MDLCSTGAEGRRIAAQNHLCETVFEGVHYPFCIFIVESDVHFLCVWVAVPEGSKFPDVAFLAAHYVDFPILSLVPVKRAWVEDVLSLITHKSRRGFGSEVNIV